MTQDATSHLTHYKVLGNVTAECCSITQINCIFKCISLVLQMTLMKLRISKQAVWQLTNTPDTDAVKPSLIFLLRKFLVFLQWRHSWVQKVRKVSINRIVLVLKVEPLSYYYEWKGPFQIKILTGNAEIPTLSGTRQGIRTSWVGKWQWQEVTSPKPHN